MARRSFTTIAKRNNNETASKSKVNVSAVESTQEAPKKRAPEPVKPLSRFEYYLNNLDNSAKIDEESFAFSFNSRGSEGRQEVSLSEMGEVLDFLESFVPSKRILPERDTAINCIKKSISSDGNRVRFKTSNMPDAQEVIILQEDMPNCIRSLREVFELHASVRRNRV
jgi:hypothetical protein